MAQSPRELGLNIRSAGFNRLVSFQRYGFVRRECFACVETYAMNQDTIKGDWKQLKGKIKQHWSKLTDDDLLQVEGSFEELTGVLQKRYGLARDAAERQAREFCDECSCL
jgi:uncharacterized protein YjbJ (UPF0337 family)